MGKLQFHSRLVSAGIAALFTATLSACGSSQTAKNDQDREDYFNETSTNWAMVRGYPRGTAYNPWEAELNPKTVHGLEMVWENESDARFVIQHGDRVFSTSGDAYDLRTGELLWSSAEPVSNLVVCKGALLTAGGRRGDAAGTVIERSLASGDARTTDPTPVPDALDLVSAPVAKSSAIVFGTVGKDWRDAGAARFLAYDLVGKGSRAIVTPGDSLLSLAPVAISSGQLFAPALEPGRRGLSHVVFAATIDAEAAVGRKDWKTELEAELDAESVDLPEVGAMVLAGRVIVPSASRRELLALDQRSGEVLWRKGSALLISSMAVNFDDAFVVGADDEGGLALEAYAVDSGQTRFSRQLGQATLTGELVLAGEVLYLGTDRGELIAIDAVKGDLLNRLELGGEVGNPIVSRGRVFASNGRRVFSLGLDRSDTSR